MVDRLQDDMKEKLEDFADTFVVRGADPTDVLDAIVEATAILRDAFDRDPAAAEDANAALDQEPSKDRPAGEKSNRGTGDV